MIITASWARRLSFFLPKELFSVLSRATLVQFQHLRQEIETPNHRRPNQILRLSDSSHNPIGMPPAGLALFSALADEWRRIQFAGFSANIFQRRQGHGLNVLGTHATLETTLKYIEVA